MVMNGNKYFWILLYFKIFNSITVVIPYAALAWTSARCCPVADRRRGTQEQAFRHWAVETRIVASAWEPRKSSLRRLVMTSGSKSRNRLVAIGKSNKVLYLTVINYVFSFKFSLQSSHRQWKVFNHPFEHFKYMRNIVFSEKPNETAKWSRHCICNSHGTRQFLWREPVRRASIESHTKFLHISVYKLLVIECSLF